MAPKTPPAKPEKLNVTVKPAEKPLKPETLAEIVETVFEVLAEERRKRNGGGKDAA